MKRYTYFDGDTFERNGRTFSVTHPYDDSGDAPWERDDGHGPVTNWTTREKRPGEWLLGADRSHRRYYDAQEATQIARRDGWGLAPDDLAAFEKQEGRKATRRMIAAEAVRRDYEHLRRWCNDQWQYVGVVVKHPDSGESESLWGIESDAYDYLAETAHDLADQINDRLDDALALDIAAARPDLAPQYTDA